MYASRTPWMLLFAVLLIGFHLRDVDGSTRECYVCSNKDKACLDPFKTDAPSIRKETCKGSCAKIKNLDNQEIGRICMPDLMKSECKEMEFGPTKTHTCFCDGNLCNSSTTQRTSAWGPAIAVALAIYIQRRMQ